MTIVCLDTEGIFAANNGASEDFDTKIVQLSVLVSSYFIYNHKYDGLQHDIDFVHLVTEFAANILEQEKSLNKCNEQDVLPFYMPDFMWLMRDLTLTIPKDTETGKQMTLRDYMIKRVWNGSMHSMNKKARQRALIRERILRFFHSFDATGLAPPHHDEEIMKNIGNPEYEDELEERFLKGVDEMVKKIRKIVRPKRSINGQVFTGPELALWIEQMVHCINTGKQPKLGSTWKRVIQKKYQDTIDLCFENYKQLLVIENMPIDEEKINKQHTTAMQHLVTKQFTRDTQGVFDANLSKEYMDRLYENCTNYLKNILLKNENESRIYCTNLTKTLEAEHLSWLTNPDTLDEKTNFEELRQKFETCKNEYMLMTKDRGPCGDAIWVNYEADVIKQVNALKAHWKTIKEFDDKTKKTLASLEEQQETNKKMMTDLANQKRQMAEQQRILESEKQKAMAFEQQVKARNERIRAMNAEMSKKSEAQRREIDRITKQHQQWQNDAVCTYFTMYLIIN